MANFSKSHQSINRAAALSLAKKHGIKARDIDIWNPISPCRFKWSIGSHTGIIDVVTGKVYETTSGTTVEMETE